MIPSTAVAWFCLVRLWLGALLGHLVHPLSWFAGGPFALLQLVSTRAAVSSYDATYQDSAGRRGILALNSVDQVWALGPFPWSSPFWAGFAAARMVQAAVLVDPTWAFWLRVPVLNFRCFFLLLERGAAASGEQADAPPLEGNPDRAAWLWFGVFLVPSLWFTARLFGLRGGRR